MFKIDRKSFLLGAGIVALFGLIFIFRDTLFTKKVYIEIIDEQTKQVAAFDGNGNVLAQIVPPQLTTDWEGQFDVHAYRALVTNGAFQMPMRFFKYVEHPDCVEAGCFMTLTLNGWLKEPNSREYICSNIDSSSRYRTKPNSIVFRCN